MPFQQKDSIEYYTFNNLDFNGLNHAVFTRRNGVSPSPWESLNFGAQVGDEPTRVKENYRRAFNALDCDIESLFDAWQVHGTNIVFVDEPRSGLPHIKADILLTNHPEITLFMRFADCVPILLFDPEKKVIGLAHAGWLGTLHGVAGITVKAMVEHYGTNPAHIHAAIGPSIGPEIYEVGSDVVSLAQNSVHYSKEDIHSGFNVNGSSTFMNLWALNEINLKNSGVKEIEVASICTASYLNNWYSHRGEGGKTGRFGVLFNLG